MGIKTIYLKACRRWGPGGLTLSAWAWKRFLLTGDAFWRDRIDGAWMLFGGSANHCQSCFQTGRARQKGLIE